MVVCSKPNLVGCLSGRHLQTAYLSLKNKNKQTCIPEFKEKLWAGFSVNSFPYFIVSWKESIDRMLKKMGGGIYQTAAIFRRLFYWWTKLFLQCNCMHIYSEVSPIKLNGIYFQGSVPRIVASVISSFSLPFLFVCLFVSFALASCICFCFNYIFSMRVPLITFHSFHFDISLKSYK